MSETILSSTADGVVEIRFNRPAALNALNLEMAYALASAVDAALADPLTRVIVFSGEGRAFMSGGDLATIRGVRDRPAMIAQLIEALHEVVLRLAASPILTVAAAHGPIAGGGLSFFLSADFGILSDDATLAMAYARIGASPDCGGSYSLIRHVGLRKAMEIAILGETLSAQEALRLGLANRVFPRPELLTQSRAIARRLAEGPSLAYGRIKALLREASERDLKAQLAEEEKSFIALAATADFNEGLDAFFERRAPLFGGD